MFKILRFAAVVAVIFHFSPVRRADDGPGLDEVRAWADARLPAGARALWDGLPAGAARPLAEPALRKGLGLGLAPAADTLRPEDLRPAWRGAAPP
jgi:hypothetical protein